MADIDVTPIVLKDCIISIEGDDYAAAISSAVFTPSASTVIFKGLKPAAVFTDVDAATWVLALTYAQDWVNTDSLARYLHANEGQTKAAIIHPQSGAGPSFTADIVISPGAIGGAVGATPTSTVTLGCLGKPALVEPV